MMDGGSTLEGYAKGPLAPFPQQAWHLALLHIHHRQI
jgi:hypothetical protein